MFLGQFIQLSQLCSFLVLPLGAFNFQTIFRWISTLSSWPSLHGTCYWCECCPQSLTEGCFNSLWGRTDTNWNWVMGRPNPVNKQLRGFQQFRETSKHKWWTGNPLSPEEYRGHSAREAGALPGQSGNSHFVYFLLLCREARQRLSFCSRGTK